MKTCDRLAIIWLGNIFTYVHTPGELGRFLVKNILCTTAQVGFWYCYVGIVTEIIESYLIPLLDVLA